MPTEDNIAFAWFLFRVIQIIFSACYQVDAKHITQVWSIISAQP